MFSFVERNNKLAKTNTKSIKGRKIKKNISYQEKDFYKFINHFTLKGQDIDCDQLHVFTELLYSRSRSLYKLPQGPQGK